VLFLAKITGVSLDTAMCLKVGLLSIVVSVGSAGIPNSVLIPLVMLLNVAGIPVSSIGYILGVWNIIDRLGTAVNVNGDIATSLLVAKSEKELDEDVYKDIIPENTRK
ncbi:MAG: cation:dicarboxylase symporter family transporter, partial [Treponema sp.]|nr:cation:dicarboxylase symporter family transporter [Treponema sp.]